MTEAGRELVRQIDALRQTQLEAAMQSMTGEDLAALETGLKALIRALSASREQAQLSENKTKENLAK